MANIRVDVNGTIYDGIDVVFRTPCNCSEVTGLKIYYLGSKNVVTSKVFTLKDAHNNSVGNLSELFAAGVLIKVLLDVTNSYAYIQNADTNKYLEDKMSNMDIVNMHIWKKYDEEPKETKTSVSDITIAKETETSKVYPDIQYSDSYKIENGSIVLVNPTTLTAPTSSTASVLKGKYVESNYLDNIYYIDPAASITDSKISYPSPGYYTLKASKGCKLEASGAFLGYVVSNDISKYPENGEHTDSNWYIYHKPLCE